MKATMTEGSEYFPIGSLVVCNTCHNKKLEGEVLAFDPQTKMLILKCPSSNGKGNLNDVFVVNLTYVSQVEVIRESTSSPPPLQSLNLQRVTSRGRSNLDKKNKIVNAMAGVSPEGQKLFLTISKTIDELTWDGENIVVMNQVTISPPYKAENCRPKCSDSDSQAVVHVRKIVDKHNRDQQLQQPGAAQPSNISPTTSGAQTASQLPQA